MNFKVSFSILLFLVLNASREVSGKATVLTNLNFDDIVAKNELVMLNFYADWCRFSQMLAPIWDEFAEKLSARFPEEGKVVVGKVDCDNEAAISTRFHISKYPTLKLLRQGQVVKKEYRGPRTADAMVEYIVGQLRDPIKDMEDVNAMEAAKKEGKRSVYGLFEAESGPQHEHFVKLATAMKEDCLFYRGVGDKFRQHRPPSTDILTFYGTGSDEHDTFPGDVTSYAEVLAWATDRCIPLVREITFSNAEELTEEGLPFMILFRKKDDKVSPAAYRKVIERELRDEKAQINFLEADAEQFSHPLHHLGKGVGDLPIIAIDSFRHMYLFKDYSQMDTPGALKKFLADLYSGKLHREYHYGPEEDDTPQIDQVEIKTAPPKSTFKKLGPSPNRYTLLDEKDEL